MRIASNIIAAVFVLALGVKFLAAAPPVALEESVEGAIARAETGVVAISRTSATKQKPGDQPAGEFLEELQQRASAGDAVAPVACGVIIDDAGLVLTEYLAVRDGDSHTIRTVEGKAYSAKIRAADPRSGLAVLEITGSASSLDREGAAAAKSPGSFPAIPIGDASTVRKGQFVIAIGNPFAIASDGQPTASLGVITNIARKAPSGANLNDAPGPAKDFRTTIHHLGTLLQTDARLGWSTGGGALVNLRGELVGLTTTVAVIAGHEQPAGYAIPMNAAMHRIIETLKQGREVEYGMLGIGFGPDPLATNTADRPPLRVAVVYPAGPAARAGLRPEDIITHVNNQQVTDIDTVQLGVSVLAPGSKVQVAYERGGQAASAEVQLAKLAVSGKSVATQRPDDWLGMRVDYSTALDAIALKQATDSGAIDKEGCVLVAEVERDSIAWRAGARPGMFVSHVASTRVSTPDEFREAVQSLGEKFDVTFTTPLSPRADGGKEND